MMDSSKVSELKKKFIENVDLLSITEEIYYDNEGNETNVFILHDKRFVSEYQGRLYVNHYSEIFDDNWVLKPELLEEFVSEL